MNLPKRTMVRTNLIVTELGPWLTTRYLPLGSVGPVLWLDRR